MVITKEDSYPLLLVLYSCKRSLVSLFYSKRLHSTSKKKTDGYPPSMSPLPISIVLINDCLVRLKNVLKGKRSPPISFRSYTVN